MGYGIIFPGQGSQTIGMGKALYDEFSCVREGFEEASDILKRDMKALLFEENADLNRSLWTQPAILLVSVLAFRVLQQESDLKPSLLMGHSLGEFSSVCVAGGLKLGDALRLVHERGKLMQSCGNNVGMMVVMGMDESILEAFIAQKQSENKSVWIANYNSDAQIVLAGVKSDLEVLVDELKSLKAKRALLLDMSVASHCPLLQDIVPDFKALLEKYLVDNFLYSVISNATLEKYHTKDQAISLLCAQLISPVKYKQSIRAYEAEVDGFIECGYGAVLKGLNARLSQKSTLNVNDPQSLQETLEALKR